MAAFGTGLGPDPRAEARSKRIAETSKTRQANIARMGQGENAFMKGAQAVSVTAGEHLGSALAGAFGMKPQQSPEMEAANAEAKLLESINLIGGDTSSSEYAKKAARIAMDAGRQDIAFQFAQEAGAREKAEGQLVLKQELAQKKADAENFGRIPSSMKLELFASGDDAAYNMVNIPEGPERQAMMAKATEQIENEALRTKASVRDARRSLSSAVSTADTKAGRSWMTGANVYAHEGFRSNEEDVEQMNEAISMLVSSGANLLMTESRETDNPLSDADAKDMAFDALVASGRLIVEVGEGESMFGMRGRPEGHRIVTGFGPGLAPAPADPKTPATGKRRSIKY